MSEAFEAKKHAYRQTQDGIVVSFVVHPNDLPKALALASLGTRYMVGVEEIGDDEKPKDNRAAKGEASKDAPRESVKTRTQFKDKEFSQQAGIRSQDARFHEVLNRKHPRVLLRAAGDSAQAIRFYCSVTSRSQLDDVSDTGARLQWESLNAEFEGWLLTQKYAGVLR